VKPEDPPELKMPPMSVDAALDRAKEKVADYLNDKVTEALQVSGKRRLGLEIYPRGPELFAAYPRLRPSIRRQPPPRPGLPRQARARPGPAAGRVAAAAAAGDLHRPAGQHRRVDVLPAGLAGVVPPGLERTDPVGRRRGGAGWTVSPGLAWSGRPRGCRAGP